MVDVETTAFESTPFDQWILLESEDEARARRIPDFIFIASRAARECFWGQFVFCAQGDTLEGRLITSAGVYRVSDPRETWENEGGLVSARIEP